MITDRSRDTGTYAQVRTRLKVAMLLRNWETAGGISVELGTAAKGAHDAAEHATDADLKADFAEAQAYHQAAIADELTTNDEGDNEA